MTAVEQLTFLGKRSVFNTDKKFADSISMTPALSRTISEKTGARIIVVGHWETLRNAETGAGELRSLSV